VKERSLAILADAYTSPLLLNTLLREEIPTWARIPRLKEDLEKNCQGLHILDDYKASQIVSDPHSKIFLNSADVVLTALVERSKAEVEAIEGRLKAIKLLEDREGLRKALNMVGKGPSKESSSGEIRNGQRIVCDAYFNSRGEPVVLGIYASSVSKDGPQASSAIANDQEQPQKQQLHGTLYYTSPEIIRKRLPRMEDMLRKISPAKEIKNIPFHAEFALQRNRLLFSEAIPMSFGAFSLSDLPFFAFNINPYRYYFRDTIPEWKKTLERSEEKINFWVLSDLGQKAPAGAEADHDEYIETFEDLMGYCKLDLNRYTAFSVAFGRADSLEGVVKYANFDFASYVNVENEEK
jgi:hypothetical protein